MEVHVPRQSFLEDLKALEQDVIEMASLAERQLAEATESLLALDVPRAKSIIEMDDQIDKREADIEEHCLRILALQQPMAKDLRTVGTCLKVITDIERVGDLAVDLAKITLKLDGMLGSTDGIDLPRISAKARRMFRDSIEAFVKRDLEMVGSIIEADDEMDAVFREMREQLHSIMRESPDRVVEASWLLQAIIHLERVADHATNVAERVFYMETGRMEDIESKLKSSLSDDS
jgi:phosphate transport system protein